MSAIGRRRRFIIVAMGLSDPGTMGGNSKIVLELARCLAASQEVHFIVPRAKVKTVDDAIGRPAGLILHEVEPFSAGDLRHPVASTRHYTRVVREVFESLHVGADDVVYTCSDFHVDTLPGYRLKREFGYHWIAVQFLFVPFIFENLWRGYKFPALKYVLVWCYSQVLFRLACRKADAYVITNDSDRRHFDEKFQFCVFAYYGGVNVDQIPVDDVEKTRDVVFCSRLHPQKGIDGFLDTWKLVREKCPTVRLTVIGNGASAYEAMLKAKAERLGIADSIDWLGYVNNEAKYEIYKSARILVHPTVFDNNGMVAAEALCSGLPVVMYDLPALREVYTTGCTKVPFGDKRAFADQIIRLLSGSSYYSAIAPTSEQIAALRKHWDWPNRSERFRLWVQSWLCE